MPFVDGATGRVHWRRWPLDAAAARIVFVHGLGQHSGHYHRFARRLAGRGIELWALDLAGHGLSEGVVGDAGDPLDHARDLAFVLALALAESADVARVPAVPVAVMGHSLGAATVLAAHADLSDAAVGPRRGAVARTLVLCGTPAGAAERARFSPHDRVLLVHGSDDRLAPVAAVRSLARRTGVALREYADAGHDLLHEPGENAVTAEVAEFVLASPPPT